MTTEDKKEIEKRLTGFMKAMWDWQQYCENVLEKGNLPHEEKYKFKKDKLIAIFDTYCTKKERKLGRPFDASYEIDEYNIKEEKIVEIEADGKDGKKAQVHTLREDPMEEKFIYVLVKKEDVWLIDSKKAFTWKNKWENVSL